MNFFKVYDSFFGVVSGLGGKESLVLDFLVCAMQSGNNMYVGTMKKIAVNINSSKATVQRAMDSLADKGFVAMQLDGVWLINPSMVIKGNRSKEKVLIISVHRNRPPVARPVNPSEIRFLACGLCCGFVVSAC